MGKLICFGGIILGGFLGIVIFSLLSMAHKSEQIYESMDRNRKIDASADNYHQPAPETQVSRRHCQGAATERFTCISGGALNALEP